ncbi:hypothetical protein GCK32_018100 [Trichostrongylus colubriformis]
MPPMPPCENPTRNKAPPQETSNNPEQKPDANSDNSTLEPSPSLTSLNAQISDDPDSVQSSFEIEQKRNHVVQRMREFAWLCDQMTTEQLLNEFNSLPQPDVKECKACLEPQNLRKNRYTSK